MLTMHESGLIRDMLRVIESVRRDRGMQPVRSITVELSEFGGLTEDHFRSHFEEAVAGTELEKVDIEFRRVPIGPEAKLTNVLFS